MDAIWQDWEQAAVESKLREAIIGSDQTVREKLKALVSSTGADEVIAVTDTWDHADRLESYRRVAEIAKGIEMDSREIRKTEVSAAPAPAS
jgi:alkanesulfonate monooxygenase SsuD/methylene tetrahydromethanopterin reductase-like flavin-dependent oxidoreductase (luciferase family)